MIDHGRSSAGVDLEGKDGRSRAVDTGAGEEISTGTQRKKWEMGLVGQVLDSLDDRPHWPGWGRWPRAILAPCRAWQRPSIPRPTLPHMGLLWGHTPYPWPAWVQP